jgi:ribonuclease-3
MSGKLSRLEARVGHKFKNPELLERALTHRSWAHENMSGRGEEDVRGAQNESLEFVGDSVVGLAIAEELYLKHPKLDEGGLTLMKHRLVSTETLSRIAQSLDLGEYLRFGRGEERSGGRTKQALLANALEAVIGAVFFDGGYIAARHFIRGIFKEELKLVSPKSAVDYKTLLQETLQSRKLGTPDYKVVKTDGLPHERIFWVEATWQSGSSAGSGSSIKSAEMMAASEALKQLNGAETTARKQTKTGKRTTSKK